MCMDHQSGASSSHTHTMFITGTSVFCVASLLVAEEIDLVNTQNWKQLHLLRLKMWLHYFAIKDTIAEVCINIQHLCSPNV